jgi:hydroxyacylglutathione hydrolase
VQLTDRIYLVGSGSNGFSISHKADCNIYLIDGGNELALVDAGVGEDTARILDNVRKHGFDPANIRKLLLTHIHADHAGGAAELRAMLPSLTVMVSKNVALSLEEGDEEAVSLDLAKRAGFYASDYVFRLCPVDIKLQEGDEILIGDLKATVFETPGHSAGDLSFLVEISGRSHLFAGDAVFHNGRVLLQSTWDCDLQQLITSLRKLNQLPVDVFLPGHQCFSLQNGGEHIQQAVDVLDHCLIPNNLL